MKSKTLVDLMPFVPRLSPKFRSPLHLEPLVELYRRVARGEEVRACVSVPPRHMKSETSTHGDVWLAKRNPKLRILYVTHTIELAHRKARRRRQLAERAKVPIARETSGATDFAMVGEGAMRATSVGGAVVGEGFDLIVVDDAVKDRVAAESALLRDRLHAWFTDTLYPRLEPGGSVIVIGHRWHPDDLIGRLVGDDFEEVNLPAVDDEGRALDPARYDVAKLEEIRRTVGEYAWWSLYMGRPRSRGGAVFNGVTFYDALPSGCRVVVGVDLAYTIKTKSDYSVAVVCAVAPDGVWHVVHVERRQLAAPDFAAVLGGILRAHGTPTVASYVSGTERGALDFFARAGVPIQALAARADKFTRSQNCAAAWSCGRVRVPREAPWLNAFVGELASFTGTTADRNDDQVDALVSAFDSKLVSVKAAGMIAALRQSMARRSTSTLTLRDMHDGAQLLSIAERDRFR